MCRTGRTCCGGWAQRPPTKRIAWGCPPRSSPCSPTQEGCGPIFCYRISRLVFPCPLYSGSSMTDERLKMSPLGLGPTLSMEVYWVRKIYSWGYWVPQNCCEQHPPGTDVFWVLDSLCRFSHTLLLVSFLWLWRLTHTWALKNKFGPTECRVSRNYENQGFGSLLELISCFMSYLWPFKGWEWQVPLGAMRLPPNPWPQGLSDAWVPADR